MDDMDLQILFYTNPSLILPHYGEPSRLPSRSGGSAEPGRAKRGWEEGC